MDELHEQLITEPDELPACCAFLAQCRTFGFDTEFVGEDTYHPHLCLIQVATRERLILIDPLTVGPLDAFWKLITDPQNEVIVHAGREEVRLCQVWTGQPPGNLVDLQIAAGMVGMQYPIGHGSLVREMLGVQLAKGETLTEWRDRPLTRAQIRYAFDDVRYLLPLWKKLQDRLDRLQRREWAREEFARLANVLMPDDAGGPATVERWRKLRGIGTLDRRRLAIVRELFAWREAMAEKLNRPARTICRDDLVVEIARRNPARERDLTVMRGLPKRDLKDIVDVVERARALPLDACPELAGREQDPPQVGLASGILGAVLVDWCARNRITSNLVASNNDVKLLVRAHMHGQPIPVESILAHGWRQRHVLPELEAVLHGRRGIRLADINADAPLDYVDVPTPPNDGR